MVRINETMRVIHELVGKDGKKVFEKQEFLNKISAINNDAARAIEDSVKGVTNPTFEVSGKATANYNIASLKIKDGDKVIGTGSGSVSFGDYTEAPTLKSRLDLPNGTITRGKSVEDNFLVEGIDKDGKLLNLYDTASGKLIDTNRKDVTIVKTKTRQLVRGKGTESFNKAGDTIEMKRCFDNGDIHLYKVLKDGTTISTEMWEGYSKIVHINPFTNDTLSIVSRKGEPITLWIEKETATNGIEAKIFFDENLNVINVGCWGEKLHNKLSKLIGKPLSDKFIEDNGLSQVIEAFKNLPNEIKNADKINPNRVKF